MKPKLIALDLDGTLLNAQGQVSDYTCSVIQKIREAGHLVLIATGRPYRMAQQFYQQLQLDTPMINFNGALVHIPTQKWAWEKSFRIDKQYLLDFLAAQEEWQADFIASEYKKKFFITPHHLASIDPHLLGVEEVTPDTYLNPAAVTSDPYSILLQTRSSDKYALAQDMKQRFQHQLEINTWGGPLNILETCAKGITKASALTYLLDQYQLAPQDLLAFGDEHNDVEMFKLAGTCYAMKNASQTLLPYADVQTAFTNDQDGVARELERLFL